MNPNAPDMTQDGGDGTGIAPESGARDAVESQDAAGAARQNDVSNDIGQGDVTLSQEEMLGLQPPLAERGIDLGNLPGTIMAGASQSKPKPGAGQEVSGNKEDPAALLGKLAESLGISPAELMKRLGPVLKEMLNSQGSKPRRKPKGDSAKPAARPKPKPKTTSKPKGDSAKPAAKPKPKPTRTVSESITQ